jgi:hypothetical protein
MSQDDVNESSKRWRQDATVALTASIGAAILVAAGAFALGRPGGAEAKVLLESIIPTSRFLCSAVMTATATILALMLTLLGMSVNSEVDFSTTFYRRVQQIAFHDMVLLIAATVFLVLHCIPIVKSDELPGWWYTTLYYSILSASAITAGSMVGIVIQLYNAVRDLIAVFGVGDEEHRIVKCKSRTEAADASDEISDNA